MMVSTELKLWSSATNRDAKVTVFLRSYISAIWGCISPKKPTSVFLM